VSAGEELTFDYNFERYGDKPMRCFCGSQRCRKFIGGTQETTANIVELGDAEDVTNDPEPVLVQEGEMDGLVQAMLDKEVGTTQRNWDSKLLGRWVAADWLAEWLWSTPGKRQLRHTLSVMWSTWF
jgi:histone-lysine N-methyltransferase SETD2